MGNTRGLTRALVAGAVENSVRANPLRLGLMQGSAYRRGQRDAAWDRDKVLSFELELAGLAVEFKAKRLRGVLTGLSLAAALAAVVQELSRPRQFRTWHGRVAGLIPYDFRKPTPRRFLNALWAPDNRRLLVDTPFGVGWTLNLAQLPPTLMTGSRTVRREVSGYAGPHLSSSTTAG